MDRNGIIVGPHLIEREVTRSTLGRVKDLKVQVNGRRVLLSGHSESYYVKQLAQYSVLEVLPSAEIQNAIEVL